MEALYVLLTKITLLVLNQQLALPLGLEVSACLFRVTCLDPLYSYTYL